MLRINILRSPAGLIYGDDDWDWDARNVLFARQLNNCICFVSVSIGGEI